MKPTLRISDDRLRAILDIPPGLHLVPADLRGLIAAAGVRFGIDRAALAEAIRPSSDARQVVIAHGEAADPGAPAMIDPATVPPRRVAAGDRLGRWVEGHAPRPGRGVDGVEIAPGPIPAMAIGRGLAVDGEGGVVALRDGDLALGADGAFTVALSGVVERERPDATLMIPADGMVAMLHLDPGEYLTADGLRRLVTATGVVHGLAPAVLTEALTATATARDLPIARGTPAQPGGDGRIEHLIDDHIHLHADRYDRVDFHDLGRPVDVDDGAALVRLVAATPGTPGMTVRGQAVATRAGRTIDSAGIAGEGTRLADPDGSLIVAAIAGVYRRTARGQVSVRPTLAIPGDVNLRGGDVRSRFPIAIAGDAKAGFAVKGGSTVEIGGSVEDARVSARDRLTVRGGILPGAQRVKAIGVVQARHINGRTVKSGALAVTGKIRHSTVLATGSVVARSAIGGRLVSAGSLRVESLGGPDDAPTAVQVGMNPYEQTLYRQALDSHDRVAGEVVTLKERCKLIAHHRDLRRREGLDATDDERALGDALAAFQSACVALAACEATVADHDRRVRDGAGRASLATVAVAGTVHANVEIRIGPDACVVVAEPLTAVVFRLVDGAIAW